MTSHLNTAPPSWLDRCTRARLTAALSLSLLWVASCSVYDPTLLAGSGTASLTSGGDSSEVGVDLGAGQGGDGTASGALGGADTGVLPTGGSSGRAGEGSIGAEAAGEGGSPAEASGGRAASGGAGGASAGKGGAASSGGAGGGAGTAAGAGMGGGQSGGGTSAGGTSAGGTSAGGTSAGGTSAGGGSQGGAPTVLELAQGKVVTASSQQVGNDPPEGNDGDLTTRWCAVNQSFPQWWRVDLGQAHALTSFSVQFQHADRQYSYYIETSSDDLVYTLRATLSGTAAVQTSPFPAGVTARYVRITVTNAVAAVDASGTHATWACFWEFSVMGN